jgi:hypothetical protein
MFTPQLAITASDGMALTMVALLAFAFGIVLTILFTLARNAGCKHEIEEHEVHDDQRPPLPREISHHSPPPETKENWEQDADWWKK